MRRRIQIIAISLLALFGVCWLLLVREEHFTSYPLRSEQIDFVTSKSTSKASKDKSAANGIQPSNSFRVEVSSLHYSTPVNSKQGESTSQKDQLPQPTTIEEARELLTEIYYDPIIKDFRQHPEYFNEIANRVAAMALNLQDEDREAFKRELQLVLTSIEID